MYSITVMFNILFTRIKILILLLVFISASAIPCRLFSAPGPDADMSFLSEYLKKNGALQVSYTQSGDGKKLNVRVTIYTGTFAGEPVFVSKTESDEGLTAVYINYQGQPVRTKIIDKKKKAAYFITYGSPTILAIANSGKREEHIISGEAYDMPVLAFLMGLWDLSDHKVCSVNLIDHKSGAVNRVTITQTGKNTHYTMGEHKVEATRYKISTFILYETVLLYGKKDFPILLYYEGPASINFFSQIRFAISPETYKKARAVSDQ